MAESIHVSRYLVVMLLFIAFVLNWIWEVAQISAFKTAEKSMFESLLFCTVASVIDALTIWAIYLAAAFLFGRGGWKFYLTAALLAALSVIIFEKTAFAFGWWSYDERMPVVPVIGVGVLPFLQLIILAPLAIRLALYWQKRGMGSNH
ncbi:MAG: hypothetical protein M3033_15340 [Acidobacteriota bacterium]|nr:hypothetical protein [Acidobacteriota bacterium]